MFNIGYLICHGLLAHFHLAMCVQGVCMECPVLGTQVSAVRGRELLKIHAST